MDWQKFLNEHKSYVVAAAGVIAGLYLMTHGNGDVGLSVLLGALGLGAYKHDTRPPAPPAPATFVGGIMTNRDIDEIRRG